MNQKTYALFENNGSRQIAARIENAGAGIIKFPAFETTLINNEQAAKISTNLANIDWIIFPDFLSVEFFLEILEKNQVDLFDLDDIRICALGENVSDRLRFVQVHADVIPNTVETSNVLSALKSYISADDFKDLKILLLRAVDFESDLKMELLASGAEVLELPVYQLSSAGEKDFPKLKALLKGGAVDEFIFFDPMDFIALKKIFNGEPLTEVFAETAVTAANNLIYQTIREHNLKPAGLFRPENLDKV